MITGLLPWITNGPLIVVQVMSGLSVGMFLFLVSVGMRLMLGPRPSGRHQRRHWLNALALSRHDQADAIVS